MNFKSEIEQIEVAMKRAADKALHGTREERSGRFFLEKAPDETVSIDLKISHGKAKIQKAT